MTEPRQIGKEPEKPKLRQIGKSTKTGLPHFGSINDHLYRLDIGDSHYIECKSEANMRTTMSNVLGPVDRLPDCMEGYTFTTESFTGVSRQSGTVKFLLRVTRLT